MGGEEAKRAPGAKAACKVFGRRTKITQMDSVPKALRAGGSLAVLPPSLRGGNVQKSHRISGASQQHRSASARRGNNRSAKGIPKMWT